MATSNYLQKVKTKDQSKKEFGWIVNPVINVDKLPRVPYVDLDLNHILESLKNPQTPAVRGEYIHQIFQILMSSSFIGKKSSNLSKNLDFIKKMPKLSEKDLKAIQNGCFLMSILNAKGFSLMFLEETILLPDGKQKRMDAMFYNHELDTLFIIDWKTGYTCDESSLSNLSLYANRMKELNPKTKIGMFLVYVDYGVVLPGWLIPKVKRDGIKRFEHNIFKLIYYSLDINYENDFALFSEKEIENLEEYKIADEFKLSRKPDCLEDLSNKNIQQFGTIGDYDKIITRSGNQYKLPISVKTKISNNTEEEKLNLSSDNSLVKQSIPICETQEKDAVRFKDFLWEIICEGNSLKNSALYHQIKVKELKSYLVNDITNDNSRFQEFLNTYKDNLDSKIAGKFKDNEILSIKSLTNEKIDLLQIIYNIYGLQNLKISFPNMSERLVENGKEKSWQDFFQAYLKDDLETVDWFYMSSKNKKETLKIFFASLFYIGIKDALFLSKVSPMVSIDLSEQKNL